MGTNPHDYVVVNISWLLASSGIALKWKSSAQFGSKMDGLKLKMQQRAKYLFDKKTEN